MLVDALEELAFALVALTSTALIEGAPGADLTFPQWRVLVVLGEGGGRRFLRLGVLADAIASSRPSTSRLVRRLERRGLLETRPDPEDGRGLLVGLSAHGRAVRASVVGRRRDLIATRLLHADARTDLVAGLLRIAEELGSAS